MYSTGFSQFPRLVNFSERTISHPLKETRFGATPEEKAREEKKGLKIFGGLILAGLAASGIGYHFYNKLGQDLKKGHATQTQVEKATGDTLPEKQENKAAN